MVRAKLLGAVRADPLPVYRGVLDSAIGSSVEGAPARTAWARLLNPLVGRWVVRTEEPRQSGSVCRQYREAEREVARGLYCDAHRVEHEEEQR